MPRPRRPIALLERLYPARASAAPAAVEANRAVAEILGLYIDFINRSVFRRPVPPDPGFCRYLQDMCRDQSPSPESRVHSPESKYVQKESPFISMPKHTWTVSAAEAGQTLDKFLAAEIGSGPDPRRPPPASAGKSLSTAAKQTRPMFVGASTHATKYESGKIGQGARGGGPCRSSRAVEYPLRGPAPDRPEQTRRPAGGSVGAEKRRDVDPGSNRRSLPVSRKTQTVRRSSHRP